MTFVTMTSLSKRTHHLTPQKIAIEQILAISTKLSMKSLHTGILHHDDCQGNSLSTMKPCVWDSLYSSFSGMTTKGVKVVTWLKAFDQDLFTKGF
jgi:hypothetical protein